jgi:hypothetical protein
MKQYKYDKLLGIKTAENKFLIVPPSLHYNPYEPTSYEALEAFLEHYPINENDVFVDFGSGKGRTNFFLHHFTGATAKGIEMDDEFIEDAIVNREHYYRKYPHAEKNLEFIACLAEEYRITEEDNRFYFFNPFSVQIFTKVVNNILSSVAKYPRTVDILLYYPHAEFIDYLEKNNVFELVQEIKLSGFYEKNNNERILIYRYYFA